MKISLNMLKQYLKFSIETSRLCEILANLGMAVEDVTKNEYDTIIDVEITVNRSDCLSHIGIARELAAHLKMPMHKQATTMREALKPIENFVEVEIQAPDLCNRYCGRLVLGVKVQDSPEWLKNFITSIGLRPVNNVVDIGNYVMYELGQPLHTFDYDKIGKQKIIVRRAKNTEKIIAIDNKIYDLTDEMLIIADADVPVAIAGVIGGKDSEIGETTKNIFLEGAYFDPASVRKTSRKLGLTTDASFRFERKTDINVIPMALNKVAQMISDIAQGEVAKGLIDIYPVFHKDKRIRFRPARVEYLLGEKIPYSWIQELIKRLGFEILDMSEHFWLVGVPSYRSDVEREIELIELIARDYGFSKINSTLPVINKKTIPDYDNFKVENYFRKVLIGSGFNEIISYSFLSKEITAVFGEINKNEEKLKNPISEENDLLRPNLASSMSLIAQYNLQHDISELKMFEIGRVFWHDTDHKEEERLGMIMVASELKNKWDYGLGADDIFYFKGILEEVLKPWGIEWDYAGSKLDYLHPELQCTIKVHGQPVGYLGMLGVQAMQKLELNKQMAIMELTIDKLAYMPSLEMIYTPYTLHPMVERSISFLLDKSTKYADIMTTLKNIKDDRIKSFKLIDVYKGSSLPENKISYTFEVYLQDPAKNIGSDEVNDIWNYITSEFKEKLKAIVR